MDTEKRIKVVKEFAAVVNSNSLEKDSNTPDLVLGEYLFNCLEAFHKATRLRDNWYGGKQSILDSEKAETWES